MASLLFLTLLLTKIENGNIVFNVVGSYSFKVTFTFKTHIDCYNHSTGRSSTFDRRIGESRSMAYTSSRDLSTEEQLCKHGEINSGLVREKGLSPINRMIRL